MSNSLSLHSRKDWLYLWSDEQKPYGRKWALLLSVHAPCCAGSGFWLPECWQVWGQSRDSPFTFSVFQTPLSVGRSTTDLWLSDPDGKNLLAKALNFYVNINACVKKELLLQCSILFPNGPIGVPATVRRPLLNWGDLCVLTLSHHELSCPKRSHC